MGVGAGGSHVNCTDGVVVGLPKKFTAPKLEFTKILYFKKNKIKLLLLSKYFLK